MPSKIAPTVDQPISVTWTVASSHGICRPFHHRYVGFDSLMRVPCSRSPDRLAGRVPMAECRENSTPRGARGRSCVQGRGVLDALPVPHPLGRAGTALLDRDLLEAPADIDALLGAI